MNIRIWLERFTYLLGVAIIVWLLVDALRDRPPAGTETIRQDTLATELRRWSTAARPEHVHLVVDRTLPPVQRDWLSAIVRGGAHVSWEGDSVPPLATTVDPILDPDEGSLIRVAAPHGLPLTLEDEFGTLDSITAGSVGAHFITQTPVTKAGARANEFEAGSAAVDSFTLGRILVTGRVGWESGIVIGVLEERGWEVDASLALSSKGDITQGTIPTTLSAEQYSAVIVLDSILLPEPARLVRYVRDGGGLIINAAAASTSVLAPLRVGQVGQAIEGIEPFDTTLAEPRRSLAFNEIIPDPEAVVLESRDEAATIVARRVDRGRVAVIGYDDTWRWRMAGGDGAVEDHRTWWSRLVASVASAEYTPRASTGGIDEAPLASLVDRLGVPSPRPSETPTRDPLDRRWLLVVMASALLFQWFSRRLRGEP